MIFHHLDNHGGESVRVFAPRKSTKCKNKYLKNKFQYNIEIFIGYVVELLKHDGGGKLMMMPFFGTRWRNR